MGLGFRPVRGSNGWRRVRGPTGPPTAVPGDLGNVHPARGQARLDDVTGGTLSSFLCPKDPERLSTRETGLHRVKVKSPKETHPEVSLTLNHPERRCTLVRRYNQHWGSTTVIFFCPCPFLWPVR